MACQVDKKRKYDFKTLKKVYDKKVDETFDLVESYLVKGDTKLTKIINDSQSKVKLDNIFAIHATERIFSEWMRELRIQKQLIADRAKQTQEFLQGLNEEDSKALVRALGGDADPMELPQELRGMYDTFRDVINTNARELVELGVLQEENAISDYLKRYYKEYLDSSASGKAYFDKRFKARKKLTHEERLAMGMIEDASFVIPKTIADQKLQALKAKILQSIAEKFGKDEELEGYVQVPDTSVGGGVKMYGALAGKWVPQEILASLKDAAFTRKELSKWEAWVAFMDHIKVNMTVKNPFTHAYNVGSNLLMSFLHADVMALGRVMHMAHKDKAAFRALVEEANKYGLNTLLGDMENQIVLDELGKPSLIKTIAKNLYMTQDSKTGKAMRKAYEWEDKIFKLAAFDGNMRSMRKELGRDLNDAEKRQAFKEANEAYVDYDSPLPDLVKSLDKSAIFPFLHYTWKSSPVVAKAALKHPERFIIIQAALIGLGASAWFGDDEDDLKPDWAADQLNLMGAREWVNLHNGKFLNVGRLIPGAKIGGLDFSGGFVGGMMNMAQGMDTLGYDFISKYDSFTEAQLKRAAKFAESYAPPLSPIGRYGQRLFKKNILDDGKKNSSTGEVMDNAEILSQPLGIREFDIKKEVERKANAIKNKYKHDVKAGDSESEAAREYREKMRDLKEKALKQKIVGLDLEDNPPKAKKKSSSITSRVNIMPRLKL